MSIAIIFNNKAPEIWKSELEKKLPGTPVEVYPHISDKQKVTFLLCWKPSPGVVSEFPNVKVIQSVGASADNIINSQQLSPAVTLTRIVDERLSVDMFEFLLSVLLTKLKNIDQYIADQRNKVWNPRRYGTIENTVVTILGLGEIGGYVARRLAALQFVVKGWSQSEKNIAGVECFHGKAGYPDALKEADFLINLLPLTPDTRDILDLPSLSLLAKGATLINVGRGEHLVEEDLLQLLHTQHLSGAVLDVFREEPLPASHPFRTHPAVITTPHIASITNVGTAAAVVAENYRRFVSGQPLLHIVSHSKGY